MSAIVIPPSTMKAYTRLIKKQNPSAKLKHAHVLNVLCQLLGWTDYSNYERHINKTHNPRAKDQNFEATPVEWLSLPELERWSANLASGLVSELRSDQGAAIELPPSLVIGDCHLPSTPLDSAIRYQLDHIEAMPALRMSGVLYLISLLSGKPIFETSRWQVSWPDLIEYLKDDQLPEVLHRRIAYQALLNARHDHAYHEGIFEDARASLLIASQDDDGFIERIQDTLSDEQSYLANARLGAPLKGEPEFTFPVAHDAKNYTQSLALVADIRRQTSASQPMLLGTPRPNQRRVIADGFESKKRISTWMGRRRPLTISTHTLKKNLLLLGCPGAGRSMATHFLFHQALMNNSGAVIIDAKGSPQDHWSIHSIAKIHGKENSLSFLTLHHQRQLRCLNLTKCVHQSASRHVLLPAMEKSPEELKSCLWDIMDRLSRTVNGAGRQRGNGGFPYLVILNDVLAAITTEEDLTTFQQFIVRMNRNQITVILSAQDLESPLASLTPTLTNLFGGYLLMGQASIGSIPLTLDDATARDVKSQTEGEFRYVTASNGIDPVPYRFPFPIPELAHHLYLVMD